MRCEKMFEVDLQEWNKPGLKNVTKFTRTGPYSSVFLNVVAGRCVGVFLGRREFFLWILRNYSKQLLREHIRAATFDINKIYYYPTNNYYLFKVN